MPIPDEKSLLSDDVNADYDNKLKFPGIEGNKGIDIYRKNSLPGPLNESDNTGREKSDSLCGAAKNELLIGRLT